MNPKQNKIKVRFPLWQFLNQAIFCPNSKLILNPRWFWHRYQIQLLEKCWKQNYVQLLEKCWEQDYVQLWERCLNQDHEFQGN